MTRTIRSSRGSQVVPRQKWWLSACFLGYPHQGRPRPLVAVPGDGDCLPSAIYLIPGCTFVGVPPCWLTRALLEEIQTRPPDALVIQTRNPLTDRDLDLIKELSTRCALSKVSSPTALPNGSSPDATKPRRRICTIGSKNRGSKREHSLIPMRVYVPLLKESLS